MTKTPNILQRLNAVQKEVTRVAKEQPKGLQYAIVSHDAVTALVRPPLVEHGVVYYPVAMDTEQNGNRTQVKLTVRFVSIDDKEDFIDVATLGYGVDAQDKGPGKAISYAVKYALLKTFGLETGDEPEMTQDATADYQPAPKQPAPSKDTEARAVYSTLQEDMRRNKTKQEARRWWNDADVKELRKQIPADWDLTLKQELADMAANLADETAPGHLSTLEAG